MAASKSFALILHIIIISHESSSTNTSASVSEDEFPKILGGQSATDGQFTFQVALFEFGRFICGGSLISDREVLTAAHCTDKFKILPLAYSVRVGSLELNRGGETRTVSRVRQFPYYDPVSSDNDISILVLSSPVTLSDTVGLVTLPVEIPADGVAVQAIGFGLTTGQGQIFPTLQFVDLAVVSRPVCQALFQPVSIPVTENMICVQAPQNEERGVCMGDSGSALVLTGTNIQVGVISHGAGMRNSACQRTDFPSLNTNVFRYLAWIMGEEPSLNLCAKLVIFCHRVKPVLPQVFCAKYELICGFTNSLG